MNRKLGAGLVCAGLMIFSSQALAWGDRERAGLWGVIGGVVLANAWNNSHQQQAQVYEYPAVVYSSPQPRYGYDNPYYGNPGAAEAYERGRIVRQREQQARLERDAFERGYRGSWGDWR
jgi:hypothetical protein